MRFSKNMEKINMSKTAEIADLALTLKEKGHKIISMATGELTFKPASAIRKEACRVINKGETLLDTMTTINSMNPDVLIVRHPDEGISEKISKIVKSCVINAGDGSREHPTQALLDALTIKKKFVAKSPCLLFEE